MDPARALEATHPFSEDELYQALRRVMADGDARTFARELLQPPRRGLEGPRKPGPSIPYTPVESTTFSEDLLALLAVQSPELERKVEQYRRQWLSDPRVVRAEEERWIRVKQRIRDWAQEGYPSGETGS